MGQYCKCGGALVGNVPGVVAAMWWGLHTGPEHGRCDVEIALAARGADEDRREQERRAEQRRLRQG